MKRTHHFSIFMITFMLTLLMLPFFVEAQTVTLTVNGKPFPFETMVVNITGDAPEPPEPPIPPVEPPIPPIDPPPTGCGPLPPNGVGQPYVDLFGTAFPGPKNGQHVVTIPRNGGYRALVFTTDDRFDSGAFRNIEAAATPGWRRIAISRCPGRFDVDPICTVMIGTTQDQVLWSTQPWADTRYCYIEKNTTYYWNTEFLEPCTTRYCNTVLRVSNSDYQP